MPPLTQPLSFYPSTHRFLSFAFYLTVLRRLQIPLQLTFMYCDPMHQHRLITLLSRMGNFPFDILLQLFPCVLVDFSITLSLCLRLYRCFVLASVLFT
jgi:hypothetical protein